MELFITRQYIEANPEYIKTVWQIADVFNKHGTVAEIHKDFILFPSTQMSDEDKTSVEALYEASFKA